MLFSVNDTRFIATVWTQHEFTAAELFTSNIYVNTEYRTKTWNKGVGNFYFISSLFSNFHLNFCIVSVLILYNLCHACLMYQVLWLWFSADMTFKLENSWNSCSYYFNFLCRNSTLWLYCLSKITQEVANRNFKLRFFWKTILKSVHL